MVWISEVVGMDFKIASCAFLCLSSLTRRGLEDLRLAIMASMEASSSGEAASDFSWGVLVYQAPDSVGTFGVGLEAGRWRWRKELEAEQ